MNSLAAGGGAGLRDVDAGRSSPPSAAGAFHDVDGVDVELAGDAGFGFVLAEAEHADAGDEDDGRAGVAHGGRVGQGVCFVVVGVLGAVGLEGCVDRALESSRGVACGVPVDEHRADLGADEVVGAAGAEVRELLRLRGVDEVEHVGRVGEAADPALLAADARRGGRA